MLEGLTARPRLVCLLAVAAHFPGSIFFTLVALITSQTQWCPHLYLQPRPLLRESRCQCEFATHLPEGTSDSGCLKTELKPPNPNWPLPVLPTFRELHHYPVSSESQGSALVPLPLTPHPTNHQGLC